MDVISGLEQLRTLAERNGDPDQARRIREELGKLREQRFHLVVIGQFKRGKTTLINALLGEALLPVGVIPVTSVVTLISHGTERQIEVFFSNGQCLEIDAASLPLYVTEQGNPHNKKGVDHVHIAHPSPFLDRGLVLIDTPGIGSLFTHNTDTTKSFLPRIDAALFVLSPDPPITKTEYDFLDEVLAELRNVFFVLNKTDLTGKEDLDAAMEYLSSALAAKGGAGIAPVIPLSSREALLGRIEEDGDRVRRSNVEALEEAVRSLMQRNGASILHARSKVRALRFASMMRFSAGLELRALETPIKELATRRERFEREIVAIRKEHPSQEYVMNGELRALELWINGVLDDFRAGDERHLVSGLDRWGSHHAADSYCDFARGLETFSASRLTESLDNLRKRMEPEIIHRYTAIMNGQVSQTNATIDMVMQLSADIFQVPLETLPALEGLQWKEQFHYVLSDEPLFLELDSLKAFHPVLPRAYLHKRILQQARHRLMEHLSMNTGRLRSSYAYTLQEAARRFRYELEEKLDAVIAEVGRIVLEVERRKRDVSSSIGDRKAVLEERIRALLEVQEGMALDE